MADTQKKIGHTWKSGSLSEKWVTLGKIGQSGKKWVTLGKWISLENWVILGNMGHSWKEE